MERNPAAGPRSRWFWPALAVAVLAIGAAAFVFIPRPIIIAVVNHSFEMPTPDASWDTSDWGPWRTGQIIGWEIAKSAGIFRPNDADDESTTKAFAAVPDGQQTAWIDEGTISHKTVRMTVGKTYTLSVDVGKRLGPAGYDAWPGYRVALSPEGVGSRVEYDDGKLEPKPGEFVTSVVKFKCMEGEGGLVLTIALVSKGRQTNFDNVRLVEY